MHLHFFLSRIYVLYVSTRDQNVPIAADPFCLDTLPPRHVLYTHSMRVCVDSVRSRHRGPADVRTACARRPRLHEACVQILTLTNTHNPCSPRVEGTASADDHLRSSVAGRHLDLCLHWGQRGARRLCHERGSTPGFALALAPDSARSRLRVRRSYFCVDCIDCWGFLVGLEAIPASEAQETKR